jgi:hypothetical protein
MRSNTARRARQLLLLCALALSVIGMHQLVLAAPGTPHATMSAEAHTVAPPAAMTSGMTAVTTSAALPEVQPAGAPGSDMGHDLLHLCLAVLCATGGVLLLAWLLAAVDTTLPTLVTGLRPPPWLTRRPSRTAGRFLLVSLCVLRT